MSKHIEMGDKAVYRKGMRSFCIRTLEYLGDVIYLSV